MGDVDDAVGDMYMNAMYDTTSADYATFMGNFSDPNKAKEKYEIGYEALDSYVKSHANASGSTVGNARKLRNGKLKGIQKNAERSQFNLKQKKGS
jgi:hypothetical protein